MHSTKGEKEMSKMTVTLHPNGTSTAIYSDGLHKIGIKGKVRRASNVEFNNDSGLWEARLNNGLLIAKDKDRDKAIQKEIVALNKMLLKGKNVPRSKKEKIKKR
jgi:hypothetical protein